MSPENSFGRPEDMGEDPYQKLITTDDIPRSNGDKTGVPKESQADSLPEQASESITFPDGQPVRVERSNGDVEDDWRVRAPLPGDPTSLEPGFVRVAKGSGTGEYKDYTPEALAVLQPVFGEGQPVRIEGQDEIAGWTVRQQLPNGEVRVSRPSPDNPGYQQELVLSAAELLLMQLNTK